MAPRIASARRRYSGPEPIDVHPASDGTKPVPPNPNPDCAVVTLSIQSGPIGHGVVR
jgi:hypothetical protein